jgi:RNase P subunit RPR2
MSSHEDLREELEVLLGAARHLAPETDRYLAERFVTHLERTSRRRHLRLPRVNIRRRLTAGILAFAVVILGTPIAIRAATTPQLTCPATRVKLYASMAVAVGNRPVMAEHQWLWSRSPQQWPSGIVKVTFRHVGPATKSSCTIHRIGPSVHRDPQQY